MGVLMRNQTERRAKLAAEKALTASQPTMTGTAYDQMLLQLTDHQRQLKAVQSTVKKEEMKAEFLPAYRPYVTGVLKAETGVQDDVLMTVMVWSLDAGDYDQVLEIADYAMTHGLTLPARFNRDLATWLTEDMADAYHGDKGVTADHLCRVADLTEGADRPDQVTARFLKALGLALTEDDPKTALSYFERAAQLDPKSGVKKLITDLKKKVQV